MYSAAYGTIKRELVRFSAGFVGGRRLAVLRDHAAEQIEKGAAVVGSCRADLARRFLDPPQHDGRVALERRAAALAGFGQQRLQRRQQAVRPAATRADDRR